MEPFTTSLQHVLAELERLDLLIRLAVDQARQMQAEDAEFQGLYIPEHEVDALLARPAGLPYWASVSTLMPPAIKAALDRMAKDIHERCHESANQGITLRLERLTHLFELNHLDTDILMVCMAPELDLRYERLYAYLQDDVTKRRPSVDLVLNLLCASFEEKINARPRLQREAPLLKHDLIHLFDDPNHISPPLLSQYIKVDQRVVNYLLDQDSIDSHLIPVCQCAVPHTDYDSLCMDSHIKHRLKVICTQAIHTKSHPVFYFQGPYGAGKKATAHALCTELGLKLLTVHGKRIAAMDEADSLQIIPRIFREALLQEAAIYWDSFDILLNDEKHALLSTVTRALESRTNPVFLTGDSTWEPMDALHNSIFVRVELPPPNYTQRTRLWTKALEGYDSDISEHCIRSIAGKFRMTGGQIEDAAATALNLARWRNPTSVSINADDLHAACRIQSNRSLSKLARKITPHYRWQDIVLPPDRIEQLREICNYVKYRSVVYDQWGFDGKLAMGKGLNALFAGPSGTGKTMAADIMAGELGLDLYKIDLSSIVSKYIGETEKNLARIFAEAETSNAILFFDEADALFGKRSEIRDSHDRYANIEISYLLQRMEEYEGVVILSTNLRKNMDDAFVRRMHFTVEFPFPSKRNRRRIWEQIWPKELPLSPDIDTEFLSSRFELAGGNIRNIALAAAFLAADDGGSVNMDHLTKAIQREYQKMGKVVSRRDFERHRETQAQM